jgi:hypothetical protein
MDKYGKEVFTVKGKVLNLPRASSCRKVYKTTKLLTMTQAGPYVYSVSPHINEKHYTATESLSKIKEMIWYNFFNHEEDYEYDESRHYPKPFKIYLDYRLGLNIEIGEVDIFITLVRNGVFDRVVYTAPPRLIAGANWIADGTLRMSDPHFYVIRPGWPNWSNFDVQEN